MQRGGRYGVYLLKKQLAAARRNEEELDRIDEEAAEEGAGDNGDAFAGLDSRVLRPAFPLPAPAARLGPTSLDQKSGAVTAHN